MNDSLSRETLDELAQKLVQADRVGVLTGAGVSRESGVPTFREADGLWNRFRPEELANVNAFISNPERVWEWYQWRRDLIGKVEPNPGHYALAEMEQLLEQFTLVTQNVDNLHRHAGSDRVIELHGNIMRNKCHNCGVIVETEIEFAEGELPKCEACGGMIRPDVVWFGEMLPADAIEQAWNEARQCDVFFSVGTSAIVYPAAQLPFEAKAAGAYLVEVNPQKTDLTRLADLYIGTPSGEAMPKVVDALKRALEK
ncbi:NAD-dependent protein deacylase [bacterium]|nr:NAD-dependent protein deacylase [bacterium]